MSAPAVPGKQGPAGVNPIGLQEPNRGGNGASAPGPWFRLAARGWLLEGAGRPVPLEEWPATVTVATRRRNRNPGLQALWRIVSSLAWQRGDPAINWDCFVAFLLARTLVEGFAWRRQEEIGRLGISRAGGPMARDANAAQVAPVRPRTVAARIGDRPAAQGSEQQGPLVFLRGATPPNITRAGITSPGSAPKGSGAARSRGCARSGGLPPIGAVEMGRSGRPGKPEAATKMPRAGRARARQRRRFHRDQGRPPPAWSKENHPDASPGNAESRQSVFKQIQAGPTDVLRRARGGAKDGKAA